VTFRNMAAAIKVFEATLLAPNSRFDRFLNGKGDALNTTKKSGLNLFVSKERASCHYGVAPAGTGYFLFGVVEKPGSDILPPNDEGSSRHGNRK